MTKISVGMAVLAIIFLLVAIAIKAVTVGQMMPGRMPINWLKLADTALLFSIAILFWEKNKMFILTLLLRQKGV